MSQSSRRNGVGRHLLSYLAKEAKKNDCARIDLEVRSYNEARTFYEKLGFTQDHSNLIYELNEADFKKISLGSIKSNRPRNLDDIFAGTT